MEIRQWFRKTLEIGDEWNISSVDFNDEPLRVTVYMEYCGDYVCPVCGKPGVCYDTRTRT